jgi:hypothetical protein
LEGLPRRALLARARLACAVTALAAERFRLADKAKRWPKTLDELCPAFLPAVPLDPYTGKPLLLGRHAEGIVVYSVGEDGRDDGGDVGPVAAGKPADVGLRLFDADKRGLPAPPKGKDGD